MRITAAILAVSVFSSSVCLAQTAPAPSVTPPKLVPIPPGEDKIVPLKKGEPAPYDGQLFDNQTALRWGHYLEQSKEFLKLDAALSVKLLMAQQSYYENVLKLEREKYTKVTLDLEAKWKTAEYERDHPPWYKSGWFTFTVGAVAMGAAIGFGAVAFR